MTFMEKMQRREDRSTRPSLGSAGCTAKCTIRIRELRKATVMRCGYGCPVVPQVCMYHVLCWEFTSVRVGILEKVYLCLQKVPKRPHPLWAIVVIKPSSSLVVGTLCVGIVAVVMRVLGIKRPHSEWCPFYKHIVHLIQSIM